MDNLSYAPEFVAQGSNAAPVPALTMGVGAQIYNSKHGTSSFYIAVPKRQRFTTAHGLAVTYNFLRGSDQADFSGNGVDSALEFEATLLLIPGYSIGPNYVNGRLSLRMGR